jgi:hypothetical protein
LIFKIRIQNSSIDMLVVNNHINLVGTSTNSSG